MKSSPAEMNRMTIKTIKVVVPVILHFLSLFHNVKLDTSSTDASFPANSAWSVALSMDSPESR
jgi:hypothetical protein